MAEEQKESLTFPVGATPTVTTKKVDPPGKKKVIKRLVKNAKTGEVIKTEIVRIDINGETTITSYPAGTPVPNLQPAGKRSSTSVKKEDSSKPEMPRSDVGPSVPVNVPGLDDLLEKEKQLIKAKLEMQQRSAAEEKNDSNEKKNEENLEAALISIAKKRHQKDPKARRRGLAASTMPRRAESDDNEDKEQYPEDTDYRSMPAHVDDEEENKRRKERHRRRREKKHREKPAAYRDKEANDSGIDGTLDQRPYDPEDEEQELHPLEEAEMLAKQLQAAATLKQQKEAELANQPPDVPMDEVPSPTGEKAQMSEISDEDLDDKPKKKKKKHKKQKKKKKKRRRGSDEERSDWSDRERRSSTGNEPPEAEQGLTKEDVDEIRKSRSRSKSFSSLSLSTISSQFSDTFDFAEVNPMAMGDNARGGFRGRGNFPFRGRAMFRGFPMRGRPPRGGFRGGWAGFPGMFPPEAMMNPMANPMFMGRGGPEMWPRGPWGPPMMGPGPGFNNPDDGGIGIYVEDDSDSKRSRSYSSYSSYSSRSRSRSRRRHRRRHHSSSRSYSSYSRSSRSYSRSYSRSSRSYSRSYSRSSYSSYSRSRSRSRSKRSGYSSSGRSRSPHFRDIYTQGALEEAKQQEEEVPWWAEFDKTYEIQKQAEKEAKLKAKAEATKEQSGSNADGSGQEEQGTKLQGTSYDFADMTKEDIDVVRTVMSVVDKASHDQDPDVEDVRRCVSQLLQKVSTSPDLQSPESAAQECMSSLLDQICPDDPDTVARKQRLDSNIVEFPQLVDDEKSKLLRWYTIACHVTKQTRAMRHQALAAQPEDDKDSRSEEEDHKKSDERRGRRGRRRRKRRTRHRDRSRSYSRSSYSSSSSEKQQKLVNLTEEQQKSLQQAQQLLLLQQQQLQAAGILPKSLALPLASAFPNLLPPTSTTSTVPEPEVLSQRWDKDMDALLKTKSKDDITRKLMQRMKEKKQLGDADDASPFTRTKSGDNLNPEKVFSGAGSLKSRKIAISSIDKSKVFDDVSSLKKSDIAAAQASIEEITSRDQERLRAQEQHDKLAAWSDEQKSLKEEVKRKMREEIEKAERAKKELMKEQMLEAEKQKEIMRIREEVREQIRQEIRDEIAKQRQQVLEDPELKSQLMELEALRQSKISKSESGAKPYIKPLEESFVMDKDKQKKEMNLWIEEKRGKKASEMDVDEMRQMQKVYMQQLHHWSQQQQKAYMQWYWHQQQHFKQHPQRESYYNQQSVANEPDSMEFPSHDMPHSSAIHGSSMGEEIDSEMKQGSTFTHAPSQGLRRDDMEGTTHTMPPRGLMSSHAENPVRPNMPRGPRPNLQNRFPPHDQFSRGNFANNEMMVRRGPPERMMNQQRFQMRHQDMQRMRPPFQDHRDSNQGPLHQYPPAEFEMHSNQDEYKMMNTPVSGMLAQSGMNRFERPPFDSRNAPRFDGRPRAPFDGHRMPGHLMDHQRPIRPFDQRMRPPFDQQQQQQQQQQRPRAPFEQRMRPQFDQRMRLQFDPRISGPHVQQMRPPMQNQGLDGQFNQGMEGPFSQAGLPIRLGAPQIVPPGQQPPPLVPQVDENAGKNIGNDQPPPPGVDTGVSQPTSSAVTAPPGVEELRPPGEEEPTPAPVEIPQQPPKIEEEPNTEETSAKSSKKKKKKHRKHKKRRERSSSSDDDAHDAIVEQLEALQAVEEGELVEVEEGEVKSDDERKPSAIAAAARLLKQLKAKERKRHKKRKKKRRETSSSEEEKKEPVQKTPPAAAPPPDMSGLPPPPFFPEVQPEAQSEIPAHRHHPPPEIPSHIEAIEHGMRGGPVMKHLEEDHHYHPEYRGSPYAPHIQQIPERYSLPPNPQGAGEPHPGGGHHAPERNDHFTHYIGPGGDHTLGQNPVPEQKQAPSPLPMVNPDDPRELAVWARRMTEQYLDAKPGKPEFAGRKVEKIPSLLDKYIPEPEPRRITALGSTMRGTRRDFPPGRQHPDDDRVVGGKRKSERGGARGRGRKRKRGMPRNYHDWDQPIDDGLIYYYSDSSSSGWGSDKNFDDLLAKKKRETMQKPEQDKMAMNFTSPPRAIHVTNTRRPSPVPREPAWERPDILGEPQGIPVIGGVKPQPIPSLANRGGQPRGEYDHLGRMMSREDDFKMQPPDYWGLGDHQAMLRSTSQWDPQSVGGGGREQPRGGMSWPRSQMR